MSRGTALKKINAEAKRIVRLHPKTSYKSAQKQAGKKYRAGKLGAKKKSSGRKSVRRTRSRPLYSSSLSIGRARRKRRVGAASVNKSHRENVDRKKVDITIGSVTSKLSAARKQLENEIGRDEAKRFTTTSRKTYNRLTKRIREKKSLYSRLH